MGDTAGLIGRGEGMRIFIELNSLRNIDIVEWSLWGQIRYWTMYHVVKELTHRVGDMETKCNVCPNITIKLDSIVLIMTVTIDIYNHRYLYLYSNE